MNSNTNDMDQHLRDLDSQSLPDLGKQEEHWEAMKSLLASSKPETRNNKPRRRIITYMAAPVIIAGIVTFSYFASQNKKENTNSSIAQEPAISSKQGELATINSYPIDTTPSIRNNNVKDTIHLKARPEKPPKKVIMYFKARTSDGRDTVFMAVPVSEPPAAPTTSASESKAILNNFFGQLEKSAQEFVIDNRRDTLLKGNEGTILLIPAYAFGSREKVKILMKEFYSYEDIITNKLSTTSNGQQLITGGMLHLSATIAGQPAELRSGKNIRWLIPDSSASIKEMQLFTGQQQNSTIETEGGIKWEYSIGSDRSLNWIPESRRFNQVGTLMGKVVDLRDRPHKVTEGKKLKGYFTISKDAPYTKNELKVELKKKYPNYDKIIINRSSKIKEQTVTSYSLFTKQPVDQTTYTALGDTSLVYMWEAKNYKLPLLDTVFTATAISSGWDSPFFNRELKSLASKFSVDVSRLGWINCDRFLNDNRSKIQYIVNLNDTAANYYTVLVFDKYKSMMAGYVSGNKVIFSNVPRGETVKVFSVGVQNGNTVAAVETVQISNTTLNGLKFEKTTPRDFKDQAATLDR